MKNFGGVSFFAGVGTLFEGRGLLNFDQQKWGLYSRGDSIRGGVIRGSTVLVFMYVNVLL